MMYFLGAESGDAEMEDRRSAGAVPELGRRAGFP